MLCTPRNELWKNPGRQNGEEADPEAVLDIEIFDSTRAPVVVFLSDGEGRLDEDIMRGLCDRAVALG